MTIVTAVVILIAVDGGGGQSPASITLAFSLIFSLMVVIWSSLANRMHLSLQILNLYFSIYLLLPGYNHTTSGIYPFLSMRYSQDVQASGALIVLIFLMCVTGAYVLASVTTGKRVRPYIDVDPNSSRFRPNVVLAFALAAMAFVGMIFFVRQLGLEYVFSRQEGGISLSNIEAQDSGLIIAIPRALCIISSLYALMIFKGAPGNLLKWSILFLSMAPAVVVLWPAGLPRSQLFGFILLVACVFVPFDRKRSRLNLSIAYLVGAMVLMPIANAIGRRNQTFSELEFGKVLGLYFESGDFDGLQSINNAIVYVQQHGIEHGWQLLSAFLFFVPRSFWPSKGESTGMIAAETAGYQYTNVSMPLPGELLADFGWTGVVLGGVLVGWILCIIDKYIDRNWTNGGRGRLAAGLVVGYSIILYRGSLLSIIGPFALLFTLSLLVLRFGFRPLLRRPLRK